MADLGVNIAGVHFKNPVITASGTFGFGQEYARLYDVSRLGGISCKGTTLKERPGNPVREFVKRRQVYSTASDFKIRVLTRL